MALPVLVLRPQPGADEMAEQLAKENFAPVLAPIFQISALGISLPKLSGFSALIFTSANGVRQFARLSSERKLPVLAIGPRTAQSADDAGFEQVRHFDGNRTELLAALQRDASYLHLHGAHQAGNLSAEAKSHGLSCQSLAIYRSQALNSLPASACAFLQKPDGAIVFFSPRAAQIFNHLANNQGLLDNTKRFYAITISSSVAGNLNPHQWKAISIASRPNMAGIISALRKLSENKV